MTIRNFTPSLDTPCQKPAVILSKLNEIVMNLLNFIESFPDEESCFNRFKEVRDQEGVVCKKCGCEDHYWMKSIKMYQCKKCRFRTSVRSGTVMENSKLPFRYWFIAMHLMTATKKCFSALEMQRQIGHKRYQPIWELMHKLRIVMGKRDARYKLDGVVELDEGFFESAQDSENEEELKRGRGSQRQVKVLVMAESREANSERKSGDKDRACGSFKMIVIEDLKAETIENEVKKSIKSSACVRTDGFKSYSNLQDTVAQHQAIIAGTEEGSKLFPWVHTAISNAKRTLLGIYHMIKGPFMQNYLNEIAYKLNRRYIRDDIFDRMLVAATASWHEKSLVQTSG